MVRGDVLHLRIRSAMPVVALRSHCTEPKAQEKQGNSEFKAKPHRPILMRHLSGEQITAVLWPQGHCTAGKGSTEKQSPGWGRGSVITGWLLVKELLSEYSGHSENARAQQHQAVGFGYGGDLQFVDQYIA